MTNLAIQQLALKKQFPDTPCWIKRSELTWIGTLTPSPLSRSYRVRLRYKLTGSPDIEVVDPKLEMRDGEKPPHLYPDDRLCVYLPGVGDWDRGMLLAETIIPWTSEWLFHYEIWLATGEWCGGGEHPAPKKPAARNDKPKENHTTWRGACHKQRPK